MHRRWIWDPNRRAVFDELLSEFVDRRALLLESWNIVSKGSIEGLMDYLIKEDTLQQLTDLRARRCTLHAIAIGLGLDPQSIEPIAEKVGIPAILLQYHTSR